MPAGGEGRVGGGGTAVPASTVLPLCFFGSCDILKQAHHTKLHTSTIERGMVRHVLCIINVCRLDFVTSTHMRSWRYHRPARELGNGYPQTH